jgi:hypothetical protein
MPKFTDLSKNPQSKERVDPSYIADDDVKAIRDDNIRSAVYRVTENLKRILQPIDQRLFQGPNLQTGPEFTCEPSLLLNQLVYISSPGIVSTWSNNNTPQPMLGLVISRPAPTRAVVQVAGFREYTIGLGALYVGTNGQLSIIKPTTGTVQRMGYSLGDGWIYIQTIF